MKEVPCKTCIAFAMCKSRCNVDHMRSEPSLTALAAVEDCSELHIFLNSAGMDEVNAGRILFGLQPYK